MASDFTHCSFAFPGTYGHECGSPAVLVATSKSTATRNGLYFARRCEKCAQIKGGENTDLSAFVPYQPELHRNQWK